MWGWEFRVQGVGCKAVNTLGFGVLGFGVV